MKKPITDKQIEQYYALAEMKAVKKHMKAIRKARGLDYKELNLVVYLARKLMFFFTMLVMFVSCMIVPIGWLVTVPMVMLYRHLRIKLRGRNEQVLVDTITRMARDEARQELASL